MALGEIVVELDLDGRGFNSKIKIAEADLERFGKTLGLTDRKVRQSESHFHSWGRTLRDSFIVLGLARAAIHNFVSALTLVPRVIINANAEIERMKFLMMGLDQQSASFAESQQKANQQIKELLRISSTSPFELNAVTDSFVKMKAAGLDPMDGALQGLIDSVAKFGGSNEQLKRASIAIQQMAGKGVISMEELRQQLGEAIPNAMQLMSRATGMTISKMVKVISDGNLEAGSSLRAFSRQMQIENSGAAEAMSRTWLGTMNRLKNSWTEFLLEVGEAGAFDALKEQLNDLVEALQTDVELKNFAREFGKLMADMVVLLRQTLEFLWEHREVFKSLAAVYVAFKGVQIIVALKKAFVELPLVISSVTAAQTAYNASMSRSVIANNKVAASIGAFANANTVSSAAVARFTASALGAKAAVRAFFVSLNAAIGPIGWVALAVWGLYEAYKALTRQQSELNDIREKDAALLSEENIKALREEKSAQLQRIVDLENTNQRIKELMEQRLNSYTNSGEKTVAQEEAFNKAMLVANSRLAANDRTIAAIRERIQSDSERVQEGITALRERNIQKSISREKRLISEGMLEIRKTYNDAVEQVIARANEAAKISSTEEQAVFETGIAAANRARLDAEIELWKKSIDRFIKEKKEAQGRLTRADQEVIEQMREEISNREELMRRAPVNILSSSDDAESAQKKFETFAQTQARRLDVLTAKWNDYGTAVATLEGALARGEYVNLEKEAIKLAYERAESIDALVEKIALKNKVERETEGVKRQVDSLERSLSALGERASTRDNPWIKMAGSAVRSNESIKQNLDLIDRLIKESSGLDEKTKDYVATLESLRDRLVNLQPEGLDAVRVAGIDAIKNAYEEYIKSTMSAKDASEIWKKQSISDVEEFIAKVGELNPAQQEVVDKYLASLDRMALLQHNKLAKMLDDWKQDAADWSDIWASAIDGMADKLTEFVMTGKLEFRDLIESIIRMIVQSQIQKLIANVFGSFTKTGSATNYSPDNGSNFNAGLAEISANALGGIVDGRGSRALKKYSKGGIANRPQVALFGEGDTPEAYVPLPDGRRIPVNLSVEDNSKGASGGGDVQVNVINQTSQEVNSEQASTRFDGEKMIVDIILKNMSKPGPLRDSMRLASR